METKYYPVFRVDAAFEEYSINYKYIGAESKEELINRFDWKSVLNTNGRIRQFKRDADWRIEVIPHIFTDFPYKVLETTAYYE